MNAPHGQCAPTAGLHGAVRLRAEMFGASGPGLAVERGALRQAAVVGAPDAAGNLPCALSGVSAPFGGVIVTTGTNSGNATEASVLQSPRGTQIGPKGDEPGSIVTDLNFIGSSGGNNVQSTGLTRKRHE